MSHLGKPKVRFQNRPKHNKPKIRASTMVRKSVGKPYRASQETKKTLRRGVS